MDKTDIIREFYNTEVEHEWARIDGRPEFLLTCRYLNRYIRPGDKVLDIGGGPGRYALWLAEKGCEVTLLDLSPENVNFARARAAALGLRLHAVEGDARTADDTVKGPFDHVLLMGPLYHLQDENDRRHAVEASLRLLRRGGNLYVSFINIYANLIYAMKFEPTIILDQAESSLQYLDALYGKKSFCGNAFTEAFFTRQQDVLPFMAQFPLDMLHLFGQEGMTSPCEKNIMSQPRHVIDAWLDMSEKLCEREELISWAEHLMYIGRKR
ncbi:MAG TPA: class I SAM-dependent methyltransferase [Candidatus Limiplasma sp.]|nr:class I SAM-dependent methyltransferase [Candidatus Limiplasma sp.]